jgi:hypothetical protein
MPRLSLRIGARVLLGALTLVAGAAALAQAA